MRCFVIPEIDMKTVRSARWVILALAGLATACSDSDPGSLMEPELSPSMVRTAATAFADEFDTFDVGRWSAESHALGKGWFFPQNVQLRPDTLRLVIPANTYDGGEIVSRERYGWGSYEARMKTPRAPGSISAFFLYQGVPGSKNDEVDIEIWNDGSRTVMFTVWVGGRELHHVRRTLPFDPAAGFNDYRIEWADRQIRFFVNGQMMQEFRSQPSRMPRNAMYVMANVWWPTWTPFNGAVPLAQPAALEIDRIRVQPN
jgi:beta-glucanase (GH16 family)